MRGSSTISSAPMPPISSRITGARARQVARSTGLTRATRAERSAARRMAPRRTSPTRSGRTATSARTSLAAVSTAIAIASPTRSCSSAPRCSDRPASASRSAVERRRHLVAGGGAAGVEALGARALERRRGRLLAAVRMLLGLHAGVLEDALGGAGGRAAGRARPQRQGHRRVADGRAAHQGAR